MRLSPPITILAILVVGLAGIAWLAPPPSEPATVNIVLPAATYRRLAIRAEERGSAHGRPFTVMEVIEEFVNGLGSDNEIPTNTPEPSKK
jgi:hypothetical protein